MSSPRVVSLISSATEMVYALGALDCLVGRSHECDYPPQVLSLPACTRPLIDVSADSRSIDEQVRNSARSALSIYEVFDDVLERLQPTHILTQVQCEVCAVSLRDVERSVASRIASVPKVVALNPHALEGIWDDLRLVADACAVDPQPCVSRLQQQLEDLRRPPASTVACIEWVEPLMAAGNWTPELIAIAGGIDVFGKAGTHSPYITWEELIAKDPETIIVAPCGFDLTRTRAEIRWLTGRPGFAGLRAARNGRVFLADGNRYFNRPGPSVVETARIISGILHGGDSLLGTAWQPL